MHQGPSGRARSRSHKRAARAANTAAQPRQQQKQSEQQQTPSATDTWPALKDWVLVRNGTRLWRNAVPALVSKISPDSTSVCLVLPNLLALKHGFGSSKPYLELQNVLVREIRPYTGCDQANLRAMLLKAIIKGAGARRLERQASDPRLACEASPREPEASEPAAPMEVEREQAPRAADDGAPSEALAEQQPSVDDAIGAASDLLGQVEPAQEPLAVDSEFGGVCLPLRSAQAVLIDEAMLQGNDAQEDEGIGESETTSADYEADSETDESDATVTPPPARPVATPSPRAEAEQPLSQQKCSLAETGFSAAVQQRAPEAAKVSTESAKTVPMASAPPACADAPAACKTFDHRAFTRSVAQAFRSSRSTELSRQELAHDLLAEFSAEDIARGLCRLEEEDKVFLSGDLVFLL